MIKNIYISLIPFFYWAQLATSLYFGDTEIEWEKDAVWAVYFAVEGICVLLLLFQVAYGNKNIWGGQPYIYTIIAFFTINGIGAASGLARGDAKWFVWAWAAFLFAYTVWASLHIYHCKPIKHIKDALKKFGRRNY